MNDQLSEAGKRANLEYYQNKSARHEWEFERYQQKCRQVEYSFSAELPTFKPQDK